MPQNDMDYLSPDEVRNKELDILKAFDKLCTEHNLRYVLIYGTLLGALRHGGFIPWDDDIDVCMPREDYEKLYKLWKSNPKSFTYNLISSRDKTFPNSWFKLVDPDTIAYLDYYDNSVPHGLWIDIFPYDSTETLNLKVKIIFLLLKPLAFLVSVANMNPTAGNSHRWILIKKLLIPLKKSLNPFKLSAKMDYLAKKINTLGGSRVFFQVLGASCRKPINRSDIFPVSRVSFENHTFPAPSNPDKVLSVVYGNWRQLPPKEQRIRHATKVKYVHS